MNTLLFPVFESGNRSATASNVMAGIWLVHCHPVSHIQRLLSQPSAPVVYPFEVLRISGKGGPWLQSPAMIITRFDLHSIGSKEGVKGVRLAPGGVSRHANAAAAVSQLPAQ